MAHVLLHNPRMKQDHPESLVVLRLERRAIDAQCSIVNLLSWSLHVSSGPLITERERHHPANVEQCTSGESEEQRVIWHQAGVVERLMGLTEQQNDRLDALEALARGQARTSKKRALLMLDGASDTVAVIRRQRPPATVISATWYDGYCREPRL